MKGLPWLRLRRKSRLSTYIRVLVARRQPSVGVRETESRMRDAFQPVERGKKRKNGEKMMDEMHFDATGKATHRRAMRASKQANDDVLRDEA